MSSPWYESFFGCLALDFWRAAVPPELTVQEVQFLEQALEVQTPARLLDLPCGLGRHALGLAARGHRVTGFDLSAEAIRSARAEAQAQGLDVRFDQGDMRAPVPGGPYDGACCLGNSFGYLLHEETEQFVRNVHAAVRPGGRWVIDTGITAESLFPHLLPERTVEAGGVRYQVQSTFRPLIGRLEQATVLSRGSEHQESEVSYAVYTLAELRRVLEAGGWTVLHAFGGLDRRPFALGDRRLLLVAVRS
jgi:2-polyprenyl-3-methyl-5-hydroxy-6-metoxy-1,4-benzoquinol methylase